MYLYLVTALPAEARPLVSAFGLEREAGGPFDVYASSTMRLVVSGIGKVAASAAAGYLFASAGAESGGAWLNVGIAGHPKRQLGELVLAGKIQDQATGLSWYPPPVVSAPCPRDQVLTVDRPELDYTEPWAFEMEASGFVATAGRFTTGELVQCAKIVSDGPEHALERLTPRIVESLVEERIGELREIARQLLELSAETADRLADPPRFSELREQWRFSVTEQRRLRKLARRWQVLAPDASPPGLEDCRRGADVLELLESWLVLLPVRL